MTADASGAIVLDVVCAVCGRRVAYRELYPAGVARPPERGAEDPARTPERAWGYVDDGDRFGYEPLSPEGLARAAADLAAEHAESFSRLYCDECGLAYCWDHWTTEYRDEPPVCMGRCPQGHWHVLDMG